MHAESENRVFINLLINITNHCKSIILCLIYHFLIKIIQWIIAMTHKECKIKFQQLLIDDLDTSINRYYENDKTDVTKDVICIIFPPISGRFEHISSIDNILDNVFRYGFKGVLFLDPYGYPDSEFIDLSLNPSDDQNHTIRLKTLESNCISHGHSERNQDFVMVNRCIYIMQESFKAFNLQNQDYCCFGYSYGGSILLSMLSIYMPVELLAHLKSMCIIAPALVKRKAILDIYDNIDVLLICSLKDTEVILHPETDTSFSLISAETERLFLSKLNKYDIIVVGNLDHMQMFSIDCYMLYENMQSIKNIAPIF